ncbi:tetratricopeptide repeat protein 16 isoform X1 [Cricetulus griseus]|uniref:Tetratricopeptide repeat protein 16 isoform X1 n=1 Tax=Cricetulus griseus TaxID=10029 RepID=A0A9J7G9D0_CRIGR|nr:tetratricopeptide repeat protein 16 isoform X1 [Cricetulus griseus]XP_027295644.1 tetratricopeptide repeat protein 16 isoform X1 [Cricetulus griseus]
MTDSSTEESVNVQTQKIPKLQVPETRETTLQRIFGTSQVFYSVSGVVKPRLTESTVPFRVREYYHQGHHCLEQEDWEMAVLYFSRALHLNPDQGQCLYELCDFQEALYVFLQASDLQPQNPSFSYRCMACLLALNRHQDCLSLVTREVKQGRATADVYILRARIYNFFQKPKLCYQDLRSALLFNPKHPQAKGLLQVMVDQAKKSLQDASILAVQGKLHRALKRISCAIENNPLDPNLFLFRGTLHRRLQQFDPAVEDFLKAMDMVTDSQDNLVQKTQRQLLLTYNDFAVHCYTQGAYQEGVLLLNKAIRDEQNEKGLYINRGDCFFQLGNLAFAEADYKQALELCPKDEGANLRMGVLQEKMGLCEQTRRQFQKAEDHFSAAIKYNPVNAQYYLHRAKNRQLLQNIVGACQDIATVLLLNPKYPKMAPLMAKLFPGMSVEEVLNSHVAQLAKLQLRRMIESGPKASHPQSIVAKRLIERQKAQALMESWNWEQLFTRNPEEEVAPSESLQGKTLREKIEFKREVVEEKKVKILRKVTSLSDSYVDQTSSGSEFSILSPSTLETEVSTMEYKSTSNTAASSAERLLPQYLVTTKYKESLGLSMAPNVTQVSEDLHKSLTENIPDDGPRHHSSKAEATQRPKPRKTEPSQSLGKQRPSQRPSITEATKGPKPRKNRPALSPRQRLRRAKAVQAQNWKPRTNSNSQKTSSLLSNIAVIISSSNEAQDQSPVPSKADDISSYNDSTATSSTNTDSLRLSIHLSKPKYSKDQSPSHNKEEVSPTSNNYAAP